MFDKKNNGLSYENVEVSKGFILYSKNDIITTFSSGTILSYIIESMDRKLYNL